MTATELLQSIQDASNRQFGISPECPIRATSVFASYPYLERLHRKDGAEFTYDRLVSMDGPSGHILDKWVFKWDGGQSTFYVDCYSESASTCAPIGWLLLPDSEDEPWISSIHQPLTPATWDSEDAGEAWDFGDRIAVFQTNPRTAVEKICRAKMGETAKWPDREKIQEVLPSFIQYPFVLQLFYKPGRSPNGIDSNRPCLALAIQEFPYAKGEREIIAFCEFNPAGQSFHQDLPTIPSRDSARQLFFDYVTARTSVVPKRLGSMRDGYDFLHSGKSSPSQNVSEASNEIKQPTPQRRSASDIQSKLNEGPPSVDPSLLEPRLRPLIPPKKAVPSSTDSASTPPVAAPSSFPAKAPEPKTPHASAPSPASPASKDSTSSPTNPPTSSPSSSAVPPPTTHGEGAGPVGENPKAPISWSLLWAIVAGMLVLVSFGLHSQWKTETRFLKSRISTLSKEVDKLTTSLAGETASFVKEKGIWEAENKRLKAEVERMKTEAAKIGRSDAEDKRPQASRREQSTPKPKVAPKPSARPTLLVQASIDDRPVDGAVLDFAGKKRNLPVKLLLDANGDYSESTIWCWQGETLYGGWVKPFRATWSGGKEITVKLKKIPEY